MILEIKIKPNMTTLSQNKKIVIAAISIFIVSFSVMVFFLERNGDKFDHGQTDVLHNDEQNVDHDSEHTDEEIASPVEDPHVSNYVDHLKNPKAPFFVTNAEGDFKYLSEGFCELIGVSCDSIQNASLFDYVNSKDLPDLAASHSKLIQDSEDTDGLGPYRMLQSKDEKEIMVMLNAYFEVDKDDKVSEIIFEVNDITEQVEQMTDEVEDDNDVSVEDNSSEEPEVDSIDDADDSEETEDHWIEELYPQIKEMRDDKVRLMVDKVG